MKIGVLSDTHIPAQASSIPTAVLEGFKAVDMIIHAGDITARSVLEELEKIAPLKAVRGNMEGKDLAKSLPEKLLFEVLNFKIGVVHGHGLGYNALEGAHLAFIEEEVDLIIFGHSHQPYNRYHGDCLFFNPGSPTDKRWCPKYSYGILSLEEQGIVGKIIEF